MLTLKSIEIGLNKQEGKRERLDFYLKFIDEMITDSLQELAEIKENRQFFNQRYKNNFMDTDIRKSVKEILEDICEEELLYIKRKKHYQKLQEMIKKIVASPGLNR